VLGRKTGIALAATIPEFTRRMDILLTHLHMECSAVPHQRRNVTQGPIYQGVGGDHE
jgi:hypothetical protein